LSKTALGEATVGQAVNLLSNDVARFDNSFVFLPFLLIGPVETAAIVYLMWDKIGVSAIIGVATILLFIPVQGACYKQILEVVTY
jgi:ATP-binding cassette subfamily C (CFTR/MRP) protein 4